MNHNLIKFLRKLLNNSLLYLGRKINFSLNLLMYNCKPKHLEWYCSFYISMIYIAIYYCSAKNHFIKLWQNLINRWTKISTERKLLISSLMFVWKRSQKGYTRSCPCPVTGNWKVGALTRVWDHRDNLRAKFGGGRDVRYETSEKRTGVEDHKYW